MSPNNGFFSGPEPRLFAHRGASARAPENTLEAFRLLETLADMLLDRGMMGDGVIDLPRIRGWVEAAGYRGLHEAEIFSERVWWRRDPDEVLRTLKARYPDT